MQNNYKILAANIESIDAGYIWVQEKEDVINRKKRSSRAICKIKSTCDGKSTVILPQSQQLKVEFLIKEIQ